MTQFSSNKEYLLNRLDKLYNELNYIGWDGYGSYPLEKNSYENTKSVLNITDKDILKYWNLFPSPNGTFSLECKPDEIAGMSIGNTGFSWAAIDKNNNVMSGDYQFNAEHASNVLIELTHFIGY